MPSFLSWIFRKTDAFGYHVNRYYFLDLAFFLAAGFLAADFLVVFSFLGFAMGVGLQSISRFADSRPQELQAYFKLTSLGAQTCLGSPVDVPQDLHTYVFDAITGLQRCPLSVVVKPHELQL
ncbi:MAG: hypothetical protein AABZ13_08880 [Planctomycetota bacterium]